MNTPNVSVVSANPFTYENGTVKINWEAIPANPTVVMVPVELVEEVSGFNCRAEQLTDIPSLEEAILRDGGSQTTPILLSLKAPDATHPHPWLKILRGHRRSRVYRRLSKREDLTAEQREQFKFIPAQVMRGLSNSQEIDLMLDQGNVKSLAKYETALACYRLRSELMLSYYEVGIKLQGLIARNFGNEAKLVGIPTNPRDRKAYFESWFRGTIDQYIFRAMKLTPEVWDEFLLSCQEADKMKDSKGEAIRANVNVLSRKTIADLYKARMEDEESGEWDDLTGGPRFKVALQTLKDIQAGTASAPATAKVKTKKDLEERARMARSPLSRAALKWAAGEDTGTELLALDESLFKMNKILSKLAEVRDFFKGNFREVIEAVLSGNDATLDAALKAMGYEAPKPPANAGEAITRLNQLTGTATEPTGTATEPTGTATEPTGTATEPTGTATEPTGTATEPTGKGKEKGKGKGKQGS